MAVVKASALAPSVFTDEDGDGAALDTLEYDLGNLLAWDPEPIEASAVASGRREAYLKDTTAAATQKLIARLFSLPTEASEAGPVATLPEGTTTLPREKPVPEPKPETRWEKFAKEKGIKNRKRDRMVWDEQAEEWRPRWGYKRAHDKSQDWAIPIKDGDDPFVDPWEKMAVEKKQRVIKNKTNQLKNMARASAAKETKEQKAARLAVAQVSTASLGQFDKALPGEPKTKRQVGPRAKRLPTEVVTAGKDRDLSVLRRVLGGTGEGEGAAPGGVVGGVDGGAVPSGGGGAKVGKVKKRRGVHAKKGGKGPRGKGKGKH